MNNPMRGKIRLINDGIGYGLPANWPVLAPG